MTTTTEVVSLPTQGEIRKALLLAYADGAAHTSDKVEVAVANVLGLSDVQRLMRYRDGRGSKLGNEIDWVKGAGDARFGYFERVGAKLYRLTRDGKLALDRGVEINGATRTVSGRGGSAAGTGASSESKVLANASPEGEDRATAGVGERSIASELLARRAFDPTRTPTVATRRSLDGVDLESVIAEREKANQRHHQILVTLDTWLRTRDWHDIFEQQGAIDLAGTSPDWKQRVIYEAKTIRAKNELTQTRRAIGQLLEYRQLYGRRTDWLCLITDAPLSEKRAHLLNELEIAVLLTTRGDKVESQNRRGSRLARD